MVAMLQSAIPNFYVADVYWRTVMYKEKLWRTRSIPIVYVDDFVYNRMYKDAHLFSYSSIVSLTLNFDINIAIETHLPYSSHIWMHWPAQQFIASCISEHMLSYSLQIYLIYTITWRISISCHRCVLVIAYSFHPPHRPSSSTVLDVPSLTTRTLVSALGESRKAISTSLRRRMAAIGRICCRNNDEILFTSGCKFTPPSDLWSIANDKKICHSKRSQDRIRF